MSRDLEVRGAEQLSQLGARLKAAGDRGKGLRRRFLKEVRQGVNPVIPQIRAHAAAILPHAGGLAAETAAVPIAVRTSLTAKGAAVRVVSTEKSRLRDLNRGRLRHPVFGNTDVWVQQSVVPGWFTDRLEAAQPRLQGAVLQSMRQTARDIEKGT